ncbi:c-type cytochrome [PVC group bacterium]|nr:c-type cytochrome [PVC group bacterium]
MEWRSFNFKKWVVRFVMMSMGFFTMICVLGAESVKKSPGPTPELFDRGRVIYEKQCAVCHGADGAGDGEAAYLLYPKPRDFTQNKFRLVSTKNMKATDEDLFSSISRGMPGSSMPSWEHLSENDRWGLVYYVRYLAEKKSSSGEEGVLSGIETETIPWDDLIKMLSSEPNPKSSIQVTEEPQITPEGIEKGKELFAMACADCHGKEGKGDAVQKMTDSSGYAIRPRDLTTGVFMRNDSSKELYWRIIGGLPGTPMPSYYEVFTEEELWNLIHYTQTLSPPNSHNRQRLFRKEIPVQEVQNVLEKDPLAQQWMGQTPIHITMAPLWRTAEQIESIDVRVLRNDKQVGIHMTWKDDTLNDSLVKTQSFSDGVALQFSNEEDPPTFTMGSKDSPVTIWHWKAAWQKDLNQREDIEDEYPNAAVDWYESETTYEHGTPFELSQSKTELHATEYLTGHKAGNPLSDPKRKTAVEIARAKGFGTLTPMNLKKENVLVKGSWKDGVWHVVFIRDLKSGEGVEFSPQKKLSIAFAAWDGEEKDRNGQKVVSSWNRLLLMNSK